MGMHVDFISFCNLVYFAMGVKWTTLTFKELAAQRTLRMDAKYWINKKASSSKRQAASNTNQVTSLPQLGGRLQVNRKEKDGSKI